MKDKAQIFAELTDKDIARFWSKIDVRGPDECWPWIARHKKRGGRGIIRFQNVFIYAPRIALALKSGFLPDIKILACHTCDYPPCCNPAHLWWGDAAANISDAASKGRMHKWNGERAGELNPRAKLRPSDVVRIRSDPRTQWRIAEDYGVSRGTIRDIKTFKTWSSI